MNILMVIVVGLVLGLILGLFLILTWPKGLRNL